MYFDTHTLHDFEESIEGGSLRSKHRIRWYGDETLNIGTLEIKKKFNFLSWKHLYKSPIQVNLNSDTWNDFFQSSSNLNQYGSALLNLEPKSIVSYDREYYCSFDGKIRVTIDKNLKFYDQLSFNTPNTVVSNEYFDTVIVELKVSHKDYFLISEIIKTFPFSSKRFSKYCESLNPQTKFKC